MWRVVCVLMIGLHKISSAYVLITLVEGWSVLLYCHNFFYVETELVLTPVDDFKRDFWLCVWVLAAVVLAQRGSVVFFPRSAHVLVDTVVKPSNCRADLCGVAEAARCSVDHR